MKILAVSHTYIVDLNCEKLQALANLSPDIEVLVIVPKQWRPGGVLANTIEPKPLQQGNFRRVPVANFSKNNQALLTFGWEIIAILKEFRPDIIHVEQGAKSLAYAQLITLNRLLGLKAKNCFFTWWNLPYTVKFPLSILERYNLSNTHGAIAGNQDGVDILKDHGYTGPVTVMPQLGVDAERFERSPQPELQQTLGIDPETFVVGFVGRFVPEKGILTLIKALVSLSQQSWRLLLLGRGPLLDEIKQFVTAQGLQERLILIESVPHDQVPRYINLMNVLVLPSETTYQVKTLTAVGWKEQFGHVLIEAMACQVPVIGSDSGEIPYVIGEAGLVFAEGNATQLADCLQKLIEQPELTQKLAHLGYERVQQLYTNEALAQQQLAFFQTLLG